MNDLVSIIIPVYNIEKYVQACLESVAAQTYTDFEVIIVDDGSTDSSGKICDAFCMQDKRFRVVHQDNQGAGMARNTGIRHSSGHYIMFVDGDDILLPDALEVSYKLLVSGNYDWAMTGHTFADEGGNPTEPLRDSSVRETVTGEAAAEKLFFGSPYMVGNMRHLWGKLYTRAILEGLNFEPYYSGQDTHLNYRVFQRTGYGIFMDRTTILWRQRPTSISYLNRNKQIYWAFLANASLLSETLAGDETLFRTSLLKRLYRDMIVNRLHLKGTEYYDPFILKCRDIRNKTLKEYLKNHKISLKEKTVMGLLRLFPGLFKIVFKIKGN